MNFNRLINDSKEGLKRKISSRREKIIVSINEFNKLSERYFNQIKEGENFTIEFEKIDKEILIFILRWYYNSCFNISNTSIDNIYLDV